MKQKSNIIFCSVIGIVIVSVWLGVSIQHHKEDSRVLMNSGLEEKVLTIGTATLQVAVAQTVEQRVAGLSHWSSLAEGYGMLFIFDIDGTHGIWMKDMQFPIDIVWISAAMKVVHIERSVSPDTYPQTFLPPIPARYILEVPAEYTQGRVNIGDTVMFQ